MVSRASEEHAGGKCLERGVAEKMGLMIPIVFNALIEVGSTSLLKRSRTCTGLRMGCMSALHVR